MHAQDQPSGEGLSHEDGFTRILGRRRGLVSPDQEAREDLGSNRPFSPAYLREQQLAQAVREGDLGQALAELTRLDLGAPLAARLFAAVLEQIPAISSAEDEQLQELALECSGTINPYAHFILKRADGGLHLWSHWSWESDLFRPDCAPSGSAASTTLCHLRVVDDGSWERARTGDWAAQPEARCNACDEAAKSSQGDRFVERYTSKPSAQLAGHQRTWRDRNAETELRNLLTTHLGRGSVDTAEIPALVREAQTSGFSSLIHILGTINDGPGARSFEQELRNLFSYAERRALTIEYGRRRFTRSLTVDDWRLVMEASYKDLLAGGSARTARHTAKQMVRERLELRLRSQRPISAYRRGYHGLARRVRSQRRA